jgi:hypothetical protein
MQPHLTPKSYMSYKIISYILFEENVNYINYIIDREFAVEIAVVLISAGSRELTECACLPPPIIPFLNNLRHGEPAVLLFFLLD